MSEQATETFEPTPPIRDLPEEIEAAILDYTEACGFLAANVSQESVNSLERSRSALYATIRAALAERDASLRERPTP